MDEERLQRMMEDPNVQQSMNEALNNPDFINMLIQSNPMLRNLPNAREIITSPFMRQMMSNPAMMTQAMRMQRNVRGTNSAFPAPGATDTTTGEGQATGDNAGANAGANAAPNPQDPFAGAPRPQDFSTLSSELQALMNAFPTNPAGQSATAGANPAQGDGQQQRSQTQSPSTTEANANPFAALFGGGMPAPPPGFQADPAALQNILQMLGGGGGGEPAAPADNRPPEERYATQLRQLNDMGFFDFDRNVAALRRSGGNVQGAVEYLLGPTD
jgi:ubiquilin